MWTRADGDSARTNRTRRSLPARSLRGSKGRFRAPESRQTRPAAPGARPVRPEAFDLRARPHDHSYAMARIFTPEEANAALIELRPIVERIVEHRRNLTAAQIRQAELVTSIAGNGGDLQPSDLREG